MVPQDPRFPGKIPPAPPAGAGSPVPPRPVRPVPLPAAPTPPGVQPVSPVPKSPAPAQPLHPPAAAGRPGAGPQAQARPILAPAAPRPLPVPKGNALPVDRREDQEEEDLNLYARLERWYRASPPWMVSLVVHLAVVILLGLSLLPPLARNVVELNVHYADQEGNQLADDPIDLKTNALDAEMALAPSNMPEVDNPFAAPPKVDVNFFGSATSSEVVAPAIGLALAGREEGSKKALLEAYGGNALSEAAVKLGLEWLARQQQKDGSWSLSGPYDDGVPVENALSATAMALLAFQGNGHTHIKGLFKSNVEKGMKFLLKSQQQDGSFFFNIPGNHRMYTQGQCTITLCELYGMTHDTPLREPCERAVEFCAGAQDSLGGWRYVPGTDSDTSVTGWIVMGLQSARMAGLEVPEATLSRVSQYLNRAQKEDGARYSYLPGAEPSEVMTAEGLLCRQYLGWSQHDERIINGANFLVLPENLPKWSEGNRNVYYWYYATQMLHHLEGAQWKKWNGVMRDLLVEKQVKTGRERGSWDPMKPTPDQWGPHAGRLYVTCLSIYILEVYYRHLPLYSKVRLFKE